MTDTMTLDAKGDVVQQMTEVVELDMTGVDETTQSLLAEQYDLVVDAYNAVEGVECTSETCLLYTSVCFWMAMRKEFPIPTA